MGIDRDNHINQWNRIEIPEIDPHNYAQQIFDKDAKTVQWEKYIVFPTNGAGAIGCPQAKK